MAPPTKNGTGELEFTDDDLLRAQEAEEELDEDEIIQRAQEAEAEMSRPGTPENPARAVERSVRPMTPEESAAANPTWTPPKGPFAKYTSDPVLAQDLENASVSGLTAGVRGFNDWMTRGLADEFLGYVGSKFPRLAMPIGDAMNPSIPTPKRTYEEVRDEMREAQKVSEETDPTSYYLGGLGSVIASRNLPTAQGRWAGMVAGGAEGGVSALGNSEANLVTPTEDDILRASIETGAGAGIGAIVGGGAPPLAQFLARRVPGAASAFREWLERQAERRAVKSVTGPNQKAITSMIDKDSLQRAGRDLLDQGVVTPMASTATMRQRASALMDSAGAQVSSSLRNLDEVIPEGRELMPREMAGQAFEDVVRPRQSSTAGMQDVASRAGRDVRALLDKGARTVIGDDGVERLVFDKPISLADANRHKSDLDPFISWDSPEPKPVQEALRQLRGIINEQIESKAAQAAGASPAAAQSFEDFIGSKALYGSMADVAVPGLKQEARDLSNRIASPSDLGVGLSSALAASIASGGDMSTSALTGLGMLGLNKFGRAYGNQLSATGLDAISRPGGRLDRLAGTAAEEIAPYLQSALTSGLIQPAGRAMAGSEAAASAIDFRNGPEAQSRTPAGRALRQALYANPQAFGRYADRLATAAENGEAALALQDYMMGHADPEYAEIRKRALEGVDAQ